MIEFIHTADIHFGMENYGKIDPKTGIHTRLLDFEKALNFCVDYAIEKDVDFFLFSGDAYKTANPSPTQQKLFMQCLFKLYAHNIPIVIIVGNHDNPLTFGKASALDVFSNLPLDGFHVFSKPGSITLKTKRGPVQIVGIPWPTRNSITLSNAYLYQTAAALTEHISQAVGKLISQYATDLNPTIPAVLAGHLTVASGVFSGSEKRAIYGTDPVLLPSQLAIAPFDYVALGHLHRYQNLNPDGYPAVIYSGSIERIDFGERKEEKGFCHVIIPEKDKATHTFVKTPTRNFVQVDITLKAQEEIGILPQAGKPNHQTAQILAEIKKHNIAHAVIKIRYFLPEGERDIVNLKTIQQACAHAMHIAGIIPIQPIKTRTTRTITQTDMDLQTLLKTYLGSKKEYACHTTQLLQKAAQLEEEISTAASNLVEE